MKVLITGNLGFVGSHLTKRFLELGDEVVGIDNGSRPAVSEQKGVRTIKRNVAQALTQIQWVNSAYPDIIFHCAAPVGAATMKPETQTLWQIIRDAHAVLDFAALTGAKVVAFSSPEAYGWGDGTPFDEGVHLEVHLPYNPRYEYPIGKIAMECMGFNHPHLYVQFLRPYNMCGPNQNPAGGFVMARMIDCVKRGVPITIFGDGSQRRQFIHIEDVVDFCVMLAKAGYNHETAARLAADPKSLYWGSKSIWNLANPDSIISMNDLAQRIITIAGEGSIEYVDPRIVLDNPHYIEAPEKFVDVTKALSTGWRATRSLDDVIKELLK